MRDTVYTRLTGEGPYFDSRVVYVSETGPKTRRTKRLAIMDQDGANHRFVTNGQAIVLTPRFAPNQQSIVYMSYVNDRPRVYVYDIGSGRQRLVVDQPNITFAPRFSPDGRYIVFSMAVNGNTDIYRVSASGGAATRLTTAPGIDTAPSYSPDGSRIAFIGREEAKPATIPGMPEKPKGAEAAADAKIVTDLFWRFDARRESKPGANHLYAVELGTAAVTRMTSGDTNQIDRTGIAWMPDSRHVIGSHTVDPINGPLESDLYLYDVAGKRRRNG